MGSRKFGVYESLNPTIKSLSVTPSDFSIGGIIGHFERKYLVPFQVRTPKEKLTIFGVDTADSSFYGSDAVNGFFNNTVGVDAKLFIKSHVGYTGSAIDAVVSYTNIQNQDSTPANVIKLESAYQSNLDYGISGNRTGYTIENAYRFTTTVATSGVTGDSTIILTSVIGIKVGDVVEITGDSSAIYKTITTVNQGTKTIGFSGTLGQAVTAGNATKVMGLKLHIWRRDLNGIVSEVDTQLGSTIVSLNSSDTDNFIESVFNKTSSWVKVTRVSTTPTSPEKDFPANVSTVAYLSSGADGTSPTTSAHWSADLIAFDNTPVRFIANPETTNITIQQAIETYCQGRQDKPKVIYNIPSNQTKSALVTIGNNYQRGDSVLGIIATPSLKIQDPYSNNSVSTRTIPNVGHVMGLEIYTIGNLGVHYIPLKTTPIRGIVDIDNSNQTSFTDADRTDLGDAGINLIQYVKGYGYVLRNGRTPSTSLEFRYFNGIVMREYIGQSIVESLQSNEGEPNSYDKILGGKDAITFFMSRLWRQGSTGTVPTGETFGQFIKSDGTASKESDAYIVQADAINNPVDAIQRGERNYDIWFAYPAPTESIKIGVGILLPSQS